MSVNLKIGLLLGVLLFVGGAIWSFLTEIQLFVVNQVAAFSGYRVQPSIAYGDAVAQRMDIYHPQETSNELLPVVVFFYGGCWGACSTHKKQYYAFMAEAFSSNKMIAVIPDYRLYPDVNFPGIMADASQALEWVHSNIGKYGGDPDRIFVMGHSSGAHIAAMLAVNPQYLTASTYRSLKGLIGLAGPYNFLPFDEDYMPTLFGPPMSAVESQPIHFVKGSEPPALLLYGAADTRIKLVNIETMTNKIQASGGGVEKHIYPDVDHAKILAGYSALYRNKMPVFADTLRFIHRYAGSSMTEGTTAPTVNQVVEQKSYAD